MGVYINIEMPKSCGFCRLRHADTFHGDACSITIGLWCEFQKRPDNCPLVPVPPYGRLVDADKLTEEIQLFIKENMLSRDDARELLETIDDAPTIILAEEGE